jgi:hypothetical protein
LPICRSSGWLRPARQVVQNIVTLLSAKDQQPEDVLCFAVIRSHELRRREQQYDDMTWEQFTGGRSPRVHAIVTPWRRAPAAMRAPSSRAIRLMCIQMIFDLKAHEFVDAVLDAPTDDAWLPRAAAPGEPGRPDPPTTSYRVRLSRSVVTASDLKAQRYVCAIPRAHGGARDS